MIKKILLALGIISFSLIGFSNGYYTAYIDTDNSLASNYSDATFNPDSDGNFNMTVNGETKNVFYLNSAGGSWFVYRTMYFYYDDDNLNFWAKNRDYYYTGLVNKFRISTASDIPNLNRFDWFNGTGTREDVKNSGIGGHITSILYYPQSSSADTPGGNFCFVSDDLDLSVCVSCYASNSFAGCSDSYAGGVLTTNDNSFYFNNLDNSLLKLSALVDNSGGGDSSSNSIDYTCTKEIALKWYEKNGYSSKLCYGGFDNFNLFTGAVNDLPFYGSGLDIEEIWFNTAQYRIYGDTGSGMGYNDWFHYWRLVYNSYYRTVNEGGVLDNPFNNTPLVLFTYFSAVNQFGRNLKDKDILEYCDLKLYTSDYSAVYSGNYGDKVCSPLAWIEESINNLNSSGVVDLGVNINGNFGSGDSGSGNSGQNFADGKSFIQSFVQFIDSDKFKGTNTGSNGIVPGYIVLVLCALLLFRFLMH